VKDNKLYLGIDQGSSATKAVLINSEKAVIWNQKVEVSTVVSNNTNVTQEPEELLESVRYLIEAAKGFALEANSKVEAIGFSFQRSGVCAWEKKSGRVVHRLISWRDTSSRAFLQSISDKHHIIKQKTSLPVVPHYAGGKFYRLHKEFPDSDILIGTLDTYIINRLSDNHVFITEDTMASRTLLYSMIDNKWDAELCRIFSLKKNRLAKISSSIGDLTSIGGIPVHAMLGDQQAALLASIKNNGCRTSLSMGTVSSICLATGSKPVRLPGFVSNILFSRQIEAERSKYYEYLLEGLTNASGVVIDYLKSKGTEIFQIDDLCLEANKMDGVDGPVAFVPLSGTATPDWKYDIPSVISQNKYTEGQLVRACIESIGSFISENFLALKREGLLSEEPVIVTGGLSKISYLLQYISDCTDLVLFCPDLPEESARGAAIAAMGLQAKSLPVEKKGLIIKPLNSSAKARFQRWQALKDTVMTGTILKEWKVLKDTI